MWVSPFGDLRIVGYLLLPEAFRSLSRPSSALSAKASTTVRCHYSVSDRLLCSLSIRFIFKIPFQISLSGFLFSEPEVLSNFLGLITSHTLVCDASDVFSYLLRFTFDLDVCICGFQGTSFRA